MYDNRTVDIADSSYKTQRVHTNRLKPLPESMLWGDESPPKFEHTQENNSNKEDSHSPTAQLAREFSPSTFYPLPVPDVMEGDGNQVERASPVPNDLDAPQQILPAPIAEPQQILPAPNVEPLPEQIADDFPPLLFIDVEEQEDPVISPVHFSPELANADPLVDNDPRARLNLRPRNTLKKPKKFGQ